MVTNDSSTSGSEKDKITVLFGTRTSLRTPLLPNSILMVPVADSWNDFGYQTRVDVRIQLDGMETPFATSAFLGFVTTDPNSANGTAPLIELVRKAPNEVYRATDSDPFFTMLLDMKAYREIVRTLGTGQASDVLTAARDVVAAQEASAKPNWLDAAVKTEVFGRSFMRNAESYFTYKNGGAILRGLDQEELRRLSRTISINFQLAGRQNPHALSFHFDHEAELPKRIAVVIGKNGVGKSQTLGRIARAALEGLPSLVDGETGERVLLNRLLAFAPTNEAGSVFPGDRRKRPKIWYRRFSLNRTTARRGASGVADMVLQVARSTETIGNAARWELLLGALQAIDNWEQICLPARDGLRSPIPLGALRRGSEQTVLDTFAAVDVNAEPVRFISRESYPLSSGEISFMRFATQASLHVENGSLLLLDEPETHLHPNFISQFVALLDRLLEQTGSAAIIATHSVYFVREVFQDQVIVLRQDQDGRVITEVPALRTFGADVGAISYFVFGEDTSSRLASKVEKKLLSQYKTWAALYGDYKDKLSLEMLGDLRESMEGGKQP